jgi:hypothetical protein
VDVDVVPLEERRVDAESHGAALDDAQRRLRAFPHHVPELAGEDQPALAWRPRRLDEQDIAPTGVQARPVATPGTLTRIATSFSKRGGPSTEGRSPVVSVTRSALPSAIRTAAWRNAVPISRSRFRTPASRV